ncbi:hypothetical protein SAMN02745824_2944 [Parasphingorhabdus marina DSM 22363]|uniref:THAP4-like heme-binding beta-barrel domain-containing protein n=1 Tax=Parasphingorhabdus marina DSM 22363 TaxID=1123272 RepID=A0A1N6GR37_9SPHN|nr:hypothetical protein [Parasphingorhabdus marina]SIO09957.1 hypothetical protein SAMN02745824_2944 [Parasphingorhabdus marina DSM 22363]
MIELLLTALLATATEPATSQDPAGQPTDEIRWLTGHWAGPGKLFGNPVRMELKICPVAGEQGFALDYAIRGEDPSSVSIIFAGHALYWPNQESGWSGRWVGSNRVNHQLDARVESHALETIWRNAEVETGRTSYALDATETLVVTDWVREAKGNFRQFASGRYKRSGDCA